MTAADWVALAAFGSVTVAIGVLLGLWLASVLSANRPPVVKPVVDRRPGRRLVRRGPFDWAKEGGDAA